RRRSHTSVRSVSFVFLSWPRFRLGGSVLFCCGHCAGQALDVGKGAPGVEQGIPVARPGLEQGALRVKGLENRELSILNPLERQLVSRLRIGKHLLPQLPDLARGDLVADMG